MSIFGLPLSMFKVPEVSDDMGDFEFIQGKVLSSDYFQVSGDIDALNDTIEFVVPNGKTAFMIEAKIVPTNHVNPPAQANSTSNTIINNRVQAVLKIDNSIKDTANVGTVMNATSNSFSSIGGAGTGTGDQKNDPFNVVGLSLVGDGVKKIEIENVLNNGTASATMSGYLIDT